jgi:hypothetical protein
LSLHVGIGVGFLWHRIGVTQNAELPHGPAGRGLRWTAVPARSATRNESEEGLEKEEGMLIGWTREPSMPVRAAALLYIPAFVQVDLDVFLLH